MDRAGLITLEQARAAGLSFDEPEPRACPHCGAALEPLGAALAAALSLLLALYNVGGGPLGNLNDIGGWRNRALYIALTAAVQLFVLQAR